MITGANCRPRMTLNLSKDRHKPEFPKLKAIVNKTCNDTLVSWLAWFYGEDVHKIPKID